jgi:sulfate adenylyltransferase
MLLGALPPAFTADLPLAVRADLPVSPGDRLALRDAEGVTLAGLEVTSPPPALSGAVVAVSGATHVDAIDLRLTPEHVAAWASGRRVLGALSPGPLRAAQLDAVARAAGDAAVLLLATLGPHDVGDAAWYARLAAARATADALRARLGAPDRVALVAVPDPGRNHLRDAVVRAYGAEPLRLPADDSPWPPAVEQALRPAPPLEQGVVLLLTGLSGSGKSTVARAVSARLMELGPRRVTLLDGDVVRRSLSSELGFSREHRDLNVRRIGWVAAEIGRHGGLAVTCPIAPYASSRNAVRAMAAQAGAAYVLVHVSTPLEVCEARDRKGLYALARAGKIAEFTGISDPYETPTDADLTIDTSRVAVDDAVELILTELRGRGLIA